MTLRRTLDRTWTLVVRAAFVLMIPIWIGLWAQRLGYVRFAIVVTALFLLGVVAGWPRRRRRGAGRHSRKATIR